MITNSINRKFFCGSFCGIVSSWEVILQACSTFSCRAPVREEKSLPKSFQLATETQFKVCPERRKQWRRWGDLWRGHLKRRWRYLQVCRVFRTNKLPEILTHQVFPLQCRTGDMTKDCSRHCWSVSTSMYIQLLFATALDIWCKFALFSSSNDLNASSYC